MIAETKKPVIITPISVPVLVLISKDFLAAAPKIIGNDNKNENCAASARFNPINNPVLIVMPDRDTPGMRASA